MTSIGDKIRYYRKEKGWTQKQLGEACGINESNLRKYELGKQNPKLDTLTKIAEALGVSVYALINTAFNSLDAFPPMDQQSAGSGCTDPASVKQMQAYARSLIRPKEAGSKTLADESLSRAGQLLCSLNPSGQAKALELLELLSKVPEYQKQT